MTTWVMTAKSCTIYDDQRNEYRTFFEGDEFTEGEDDHLLAKMGDHLFAEQEKEKETEIDLHKMKVADLVDLAAEHGVEPKSMKKQDLIEAIEASMVNTEVGE